MSYKKTEIVWIGMRDITPSEAQAFIDAGGVNRPVSKMLVNDYASEMKAGNWRETGASIEVNEKGQIINGQHRLSAIVKSGMTIRTAFTIHRGDVDALNIPLDLGKKRTTSDIVGIDKREATILSFYAREFLRDGSKIESIVSDLYSIVSDRLSEYVKKTGNSKRQGTTSSPVDAGVFLAFMNGKDFTNQYRGMILDDFVSFDPVTSSLYKRIKSVRDPGSSSNRRVLFSAVYSVAMGSGKIRFSEEDLKDEWNKAGLALDKITNNR